MNQRMDLEEEPFELELEGEREGEFESADEFFGEFEDEADTSHCNCRGGFRSRPPSSASSRPLPSKSAQQQMQHHRSHAANFGKAIAALNRHIVKKGGLYQFNLPVRNVSQIASKRFPCMYPAHRTLQKWRYGAATVKPPSSPS